MSCLKLQTLVAVSIQYQILLAVGWKAKIIHKYLYSVLLLIFLFLPHTSFGGYVADCCQTLQRFDQKFGALAPLHKIDIP